MSPGVDNAGRRPLSGIRVLDVSQILSGPYCTMILADLGAEVIKVEPTDAGDRARTIGPAAGDDPDDGSAYFVSVNRGKKSLALDLKDREGRDIFLRLAERCDVLVENFTPGTMARLGLGAEAVLERNPKIVYASVSGFGQTGPDAQRPALDIIAQAKGGMMSVTGEPGGPPVRPGASLGDSVAGMFAAIAVLAALHQRRETGRGQTIDISMLDSQVTLLENAFARYFATGEVPGPTGSRHPALTPFQAFAASDGWLVAAVLHDTPEAWTRFCGIVGRSDLADDGRFADGSRRTQNAAVLIPELETAFRKKPVAAWVSELLAAGIPAAPVQTIDQVARDRQVEHRGMLEEVPLGKGTFPVANTPFRFGAAASGPSGPAPRLGTHGREILSEVLGLDDAEIDRLTAAGVVKRDRGREGGVEG